LPRSSRLIVLVTLAVLAVTVVARFGTSNSQAEFMGNLTASVGPGFEILLKLPDGAVISSVGAGTYNIHVNDNATNHNFHLEGAGVNMATGISDIQEVDWTVDFGDGYYSYRCDMHSSLQASFAVGNAPPIPAPAPPPAPISIPIPSVAPAPARVVVPRATEKNLVVGTLKVTLGAKQTLAVTKNGKAIKSLPSGIYNVVVADQSNKFDVTIRQIGSSSSALTSKGFKGTKTLKLDLSNGQWKIYSAANEGALFSFFKVNG
jgi:hypothetical protein